MFRLQYPIICVFTILALAAPLYVVSQEQISPENFFKSLSDVLNGNSESEIESRIIESLLSKKINQTHSDSIRPHDYFSSHVQPILQKQCISCHGESLQKSELRLDTLGAVLRGGNFGSAVVPGDAENSLLIEAVSYEHELKMPPKRKLSDEDIHILTQWIEDKAYWAQIEKNMASVMYDDIPWSFQPLQQPSIPNTKNAEWNRNPIDNFIQSTLQKNELSHSPEAEKRTLLRRVKLTLHGLPPTIEEQQEFFNDQSPDAYEKLIDRLLDSPRYGERWGQHWLDVTGFGETHGFEVNTPRPNAWQYRDYVIDAFNSDKPYTDFIIEQIAGDSYYQDVATGLLVAAPVLLPGQVGKDLPSILQARQDELNGIINVVSSSFLGVTVTCAQCHNHKFDPVTQQDYYAIQAVFAGVKHGERISKPKDYDERMQTVKQLRSIVKKLDGNFKKVRHPANPETVIIDDQGPVSGSYQNVHVSYYAKPESVAEIKEGTNKGQTFDYGGIRHLPCFSTSATLWKTPPHTDLMSYSPRLNGRYQIYVSWMCGDADATENAHYILDQDGRIETRDDQTLLAEINQKRFADQTLPNQEDEESLWSGFYPVGEHQLTPQSVILIRSGEDGLAVSADKIALQKTEKQHPHPILRPALNTHINIEKFKPKKAKYIRFTVFDVYQENEPCIDEIEVYSIENPETNAALSTEGARVKASPSWDTDIHKVEHINDGKYGNANSWIPNEKRSWIQIELDQISTVNKIIWGRDQKKEFRDRLAIAYKIETSLDEKNWVVVTSSSDRFPYRTDHHISEIKSVVGRDVNPQEYQSWLEKKEAAYTKIFRVNNLPRVYAGALGEPHDVFRLYRGDPMQKREQMMPSAIQVLGGLQVAANPSDQERRLAFAKWAASKENPLTARVLVNRLWHYHFGVGIVDTPSDLGANGGKPSHPELLDWLANAFIESGWRIKDMHRLILNSSTFRQDSRPNKAAMKIDSQNRMLWRFSPRRLEAEPIRDSILALSGKLNLKMGGPGFSVFKDNTNYVRVYDPKEKWTDNEFRRMVYATKVRMERDGTFGAFDCPDLGQTASKRPRSTTPLQALNLLNSTFILQQAAFLKQRLETEAGTDRIKQIQLCYQLAYGRTPESEEVEKVHSFIDEYGLLAFCRTVLNSSELIFIQ